MCLSGCPDYEGSTVTHIESETDQGGRETHSSGHTQAAVACHISPHTSEAAATDPPGDQSGEEGERGWPCSLVPRLSLLLRNKCAYDLIFRLGQRSYTYLLRGRGRAWD